MHSNIIIEGVPIAIYIGRGLVLWYVHAVWPWRFSDMDDGIYVHDWEEASALENGGCTDNKILKQAGEDAMDIVEIEE